MRNLRIFITFLLLAANYCYSISPIEYEGKYINSTEKVSNSRLETADILFAKRKFPEAISTYKQVLEVKEVGKAPILIKVAKSYSAINDVTHSIEYIEEYLNSDFNTDVLTDSWFDNIRETPEFANVSKKYLPRFNVWSFTYLYVALIGFYIAIILHFNKKIDRTAKIFVSSFIFIHSFFILHICLNITNYHYEFPHSYRMSTVFSFLYGPLLYFYFKRIIKQYQFKKRDLLHLIPTVLFIIYIYPIYSLPAADKLQFLLGRVENELYPTDLLDTKVLVVLKLTSLITYGFFIRKLYLASKKTKEVLPQENRIWQRNIYFIHIAYILCYAGYGVLISNNVISGFLYHSQVICMALMVMYIGYSASVQPSVFSGYLSFDKLFFKYEKSGLTESLSHELKENLIRLFDQEKIYKENDINLEKLAERLGTTRHNASQVINEHFNMNFHELVNTYRINEAKNIFTSDNQRNLNIIEVAYEVGYNNKVTFNKAFKKDTQLTPSEFQRISLKVS